MVERGGCGTGSSRACDIWGETFAGGRLPCTFLAPRTVYLKSIIRRGFLFALGARLRTARRGRKEGFLFGEGSCCCCCCVAGESGLWTVREKLLGSGQLAPLAAGGKRLSPPLPSSLPPLTFFSFLLLLVL